jgi:hypothetical protein
MITLIMLISLFHPEAGHWESIEMKAIQAPSMEECLKAADKMSELEAEPTISLDGHVFKISFTCKQEM